MASLEQVHKAYENAKLAGNVEAADRLQAILYKGMGVSAPKKFEPIPEDDTGIIGNTLKGIGTGAVGYIESAALGAATMLDEEAELKARKKIQSVADKFTPEGGDKDSKAYNVGSGLGSILGAGAATLVGGAVGGARGAIAAGTAGGVGTQVGEASERARAAGATQEQRNRAITSPLIIGAGLLETIPYLKAVGKFSAPTANSLNKMLGGDRQLKGLLDRARSAATTGGIEAVQELAQNTAQNLVEQGYNPDRELTEGAAASAGYGGATGAIFQLFIDILPGRRRGATPQRDETGPESEADVQDEVAEGEFSEAEILAAQGELFDDEAAPIPETTTPVVEVEKEKKEAAPEAAPVQGDLFGEAEADVVPKAAPKLEIPAEAIAEIKAVVEGKEQVSPVKAKGKPKRADVLAEVIKANPTVVDEKPLRQLFRKALTGAGFTRTSPNKKEQAALQARAKGATQDADVTAQPEPTTTEAGGSGASVLGNTQGVESGREQVQDPAAVKASTARGVEVSDGVIDTPTDRKGKRKATLTRPPVTKNVVAPGTTTRGTTPKLVSGRMGAAGRMEEIRKTGYIDEVPDSKNPVTDTDRQAVKNIVAIGKTAKARREKSTAAKPPARKLPEVVQEYLKDVPDPIDGIMNAINDVAIETTRPAREELEALDPTVAGLREARDVASAEKTLAWAKKNMSPEVGKFIDKKLADKKKELEEKPPIDKMLVDADLKERRRNRKRKLEKKEAQEEVLDQAQFEKAEEQLLKQLNEDVDEDKQQKTVAAKKVVEYMRVTEGFKKFATLPPKPKKSKAQKEVDEVVATLDEIEVYDEINDVVAAELGIDLNVDSFANLGKDTDALVTDLTPEIVKLLGDGDLKGAIEAVAKLPITPRVKAAAEALANYVGDAKVVVVDDKTNNAASKEFARAEKEFKQKYGEDKVLKGLYVASDNALDNTIILGPKGVNVHTLLHEMTHAATVKALTTKGDPITKQLNNIYKQVKGTLPTVYGSTNLLEFVAEAFSNPSFQKDLSKIYKKDMTLSMFQKFANAVNNLFRRIMGMSFKPVYKGDENTFSALSKTDALILQILQPAMGVNEGITLAHMSTKEGVQTVMGNLGKIQKAFKPMSKPDGAKFGDKAVDFVTGSPRKLGGALLELAPMLAMVDIATSANAKLGKMAKALNDAFLKQRADIRESDNDLNVIKGEFAKWADKQDKATITRFNDVVYSSTTKQIDVAEKKASDYKGDDLIEFNRLKKEWDALGPDGQKVYNDMRQAYRNQFVRLKEAIFGDIDKASTDAKSATQVKNLLTKRLFEKTELSVYFPLLREGEYKLVYQLKTDRESDEDQTQVEMFTTRRAMKRRMVEVENDPEVVKNKIYTYETGKKSISGGAVVPPTAFVNTILVQLDAAGVDKEVSSNILELYIDSLPESAFAKTIRKRKNIEGYIPDALYTFNRKAYDIGRQIARLSNASNLSAIQGEINEFAKLEESTMQDDPKRKGKVNAFNDIVNQLNMRANYARNPKTNLQVYAQAVNRLAFMYTIGFNASSAIVNMSQIPLFIMPYLSAEYGMGNTGRAIKDAGKLITASSSVLTKEGKKLGKSLKRRINRKDDVTEDIEFEGKASLENYFIARYDKATNSHVYDLRDDIVFPNAEVKAMVESIQPLVQAAADANQLDQSVIGSEINVDQSGQQRGITDSATRLGAWGFHNVENYNRQTTLATTYLLALRKLETDKGRPASVEEKQDLAAKSLTKTQELNGGSVKETGARLAQTDVGSVALMYKNFGIQMYYNMFKSFKVALDRDKSYTKEERKIAMKQLAGVHLTSLFFAGAQGVPIYGAIKLVANMFMDDEEEDWDSYVRRHIGEGWYKGAVTKYSGADVSKRVSLGQLLFQTNRYNPDASVEEDIFFYLGGPAWSTFSGVKRGIEDIYRGNLERGIEGMVPAAFRNLNRGLNRYNREGAATRRGDVIYDDFSAGELAGQVLGFAPRDYAFKQEQNMMSKGIERNIAEKRSTLLKKYYIASRKGDWYGRADAMGDITAFNKRHAPKYGTKVFISTDTIDKSMRQHMKQSGKMHNGVTLNPSLEAGLRMQQNEWDKGWQLF